MTDLKKNRNRLLILVIVVISALLIVLYIMSHSTYYKFNDWYVLQNNISNVKDRYGQFDIGDYKNGKPGRVGYYIYTDNGLIMPDHLKHYYYIEYDEQGAVERVYDACQPGG